MKMSLLIAAAHVTTVYDTLCNMSEANFTHLSCFLTQSTVEQRMQLRHG